MKINALRWWSGLACLAFLGMAPAALAQSADRAGSWETRLGLIFQNSADWDFEGGTTADIESDESLLLGFGYHYSDNLELGGSMTFGQTDYDADIATDPNGDGVPDGALSVSGEYESTTLLFDATWNFLPGQFTPYAS